MLTAVAGHYVFQHPTRALHTHIFPICFKILDIWKKKNKKIIGINIRIYPIPDRDVTSESETMWSAPINNHVIFGIWDWDIPTPYPQLIQHTPFVYFLPGMWLLITTGKQALLEKRLQAVRLKTAEKTAWEIHQSAEDEKTLVVLTDQWVVRYLNRRVKKEQDST